MKEGIRRHECLLQKENKTSTTITPPVVPVTAFALPRAGLCGYVVAPGATPFCDRPALAGGSYCAWHRALCAVAPASPAFAALADAQIAAADAQIAAADTHGVPPPELGWLNAPPEPFDESDDERLAGLDLPASAIGHDE